MKIVKKVHYVRKNSRHYWRRIGDRQSNAIAFAKKGIALALIDQDEQRLKTLKAELHTDQVYCFQADNSDAKRMKAIFNEISETFKVVDIVFANAGINGTVTSIEAFEPEEWEQALRVNLTYFRKKSSSSSV